MKATKSACCILSLLFLFFSIEASATVLRPELLGGAYDELLPTIVRGKPIVLSGKFRWEYDDNIYQDEAEEDKVSSWKFIAEPKIDYHYLATSTYLGAFYQFSYRWFENRPEDEEDFSHDLGVSLNHMFTDRLELRLRDVYRDREDQRTVSEELELLETTEAEPAQPESEAARTDVDETHQRNDFSGSLTYVVTEKFNLIGSFTHMWLDYEDPARSVNNDRVEWTGGGRLEYVWRPSTSLSLGYLYQDVDYDENINKVDSTTHQYYAGINHRFSPSLVGSANVGFQDRTFEAYSYVDEDGEEVIVEEREQQSPYIDVGISAPLSETLVTSVGYRYSIAETDQSLFLSEELQRLFISLTNKFTPRLSVRFNGVMQFGYFSIDEATFVDSPPPEDYTEDTIEFALVFRYQVKPGWFAEAGWRYIDVDSDFPGESYDRNRTFVGLNAIF